MEKVVPAAEREEWSRSWQAELWHIRHLNQNRPHASATNLSIGLTRDALWLRTESWRRVLSGTAALCVASLLGLCLLATLMTLALVGDWHSLRLYLGHLIEHCLFASPLVIFVAFATASHRPAERNTTTRFWIERQLFFAIKKALVLLLAFLLSANICQPIHTPLPNTGEIVQILFFVILALFGLRWAFSDQEQRCRQCLHSLATPARVGRPSHNLLEWNGTELVCKHGHGLLSVPEIETSWCRSSQWLVPNAPWKPADIL